jgi:peptide deformylase
MSILPIYIYPHPILRKKAKKVGNIDSTIYQLIDDMLETMRSASGIGLAAPQIGVLLRVIVMELPGEMPLALVNPEIIKREGERVVEEGCLSFPGYKGEVKRSVKVVVKGFDGKGRAIKLKGEGLLAQVLEHEVDHLDGILYIDRLQSPDKLYKMEEAKGA